MDIDQCIMYWHGGQDEAAPSESPAQLVLVLGRGQGPCEHVPIEARACLERASAIPFQLASVETIFLKNTVLGRGCQEQQLLFLAGGREEAGCRMGRPDPELGAEDVSWVSRKRAITSLATA